MKLPNGLEHIAHAPMQQLKTYPPLVHKTSVFLGTAFGQGRALRSSTQAIFSISKYQISTTPTALDQQIRSLASVREPNIRTLRKDFATIHGGAKQQLTCQMPSSCAGLSRMHHMLVATQIPTNLVYNTWSTSLKQAAMAEKHPGNNTWASAD